jgi:thiamine biosynthesis lipoprotein
VLERAKAMSEATGGLFDCAIAPVLMQNGYLPDLGASGDAAEFGTLRELELHSGARVHLRRRVCITLDGIAKGYAVDRAVDALRVARVRSGVVNAGGDLRVFGDALETVHVRHPRAPGTLIELGALRECAVASSAGYFSLSQVDGRTVSHIVDPRQRCCCNPPGAVVVIADHCVTADALTKPLLLEPDCGRDLAARFGAAAVFIDANGSLQ